MTTDWTTETREHRQVRRGQRHQPLLRDSRGRATYDPAARWAWIRRDVRADSPHADGAPPGHRRRPPRARARTADIDRPIDIKLMADDIAALIDHLGLEKPDIVGYSLGSGVALFTAVKYPEKVGKLISASAHVDVTPFRPRCSPSKPR